MNSNGSNPLKRSQCKPVKFELESKVDRNGAKIHFAHVKGPFTLDFSKGVSIFIFTSEEGSEEVQFKIYEDKPFYPRDDRQNGEGNYQDPQ